MPNTSMTYLDWTAIGIEASLEEFLEESPIEAVDCVVEREQDELRRALLGQAARYGGAPAVAVR